MIKFNKLVIAAVIATFASAVVYAQTAPIQFRLEQNYITGLTSPVLLTHAGDGTRRKFIVEKGGVIKVVQ
nr:hypothetical protein [Blastocatellia bacterium]